VASVAMGLGMRLGPGLALCSPGLSAELKHFWDLALPSPPNQYYRGSGKVTPRSA